MDIRPPADTKEAKLADAEAYCAQVQGIDADFRTTPEEMIKRMHAPGEIWRFNDDPWGVCRVFVSIPYQHTEVVALFPQAPATMPDLQPLLKACLIEALRAFPEAGPWTVGGTFERGVSGEMKALTWQGAVPGTTVAADANGRWVISMPTLSQLVSIVERWP